MNQPKRQKQYRKYKNAGGKSTIKKYELQHDAINLQFADGSSYRYTNQATGKENIAKMRELALAGKGLDTFVKNTVKDNYERKIR